jgi:hypothetical protein
MAARTEDLPPIQRLSKRLFGAAYRLEIAVLISDFGEAPINPTEVTKRLRDDSEDPPAHSSVAAELERLASCGLLVPLKAPVRRDAYFERAKSRFWDLCRDLRDEIRTGSLADSAPKPDPLGDPHGLPSRPTGR